MPDRVKEKLVEIIQNSVGGCARHWAEVITDGLIAHGVTVQGDKDINVPSKWILVTERLPEKSGKYLVCTNRGNVYQTKFYSYPEDKGGHWGQKDKGRSITHWMPLPQPPKGE